MAENELRAKIEQEWKKFPHCIGYPGCDGNLEAMPHEPGCPLFGKVEISRMDFLIHVASLIRKEAMEECAKFVENYGSQYPERARLAAALREQMEKEL